MSIIERLHEMRNYGGEALTRGLPDDVILQFAERDPRLGEAVDVAYSEFLSLLEEHPEFLALDEQNQRHRVEWHWVRGHTGHPENEIADRLANRGIDELKQQSGQG